MENLEEIKKLKPSDIAEAKMDSEKILYISYHHPISDAKKDYEVARYLFDEIAKLEEAKGQHLGVLIDVNNYIRLDATGHQGITTPSLRARQIHSKTFKESTAKRIAYYRKDVSFLVRTFIKVVAMYRNQEVKAFSDRKEAVKWLKEGIN